jgi:hypothetical protein
MMRVGMLNIDELANRDFAKPGELLEGDEQLAIVEEEPEAV